MTTKSRTAEEITAEILSDLQGIRDAHGEPCDVDLGAFVRLDATSGFYLDALADENLHELAEVAGSRAQAVRAWIIPALRESPIDGLTVID